MPIIKDQEGETEIFLDENNILHVKYINLPKGDVSLKIADMAISEIKRLVRESGRKQVNVLVDTRLNKRQYRFFSSKERRKAGEIVRMEELKNWAVVGDNLLMKVAANFIAASAKKNLRWFADEKEAYEWLLSLREH